MPPVPTSSRMSYLPASVWPARRAFTRESSSTIVALTRGCVSTLSVPPPARVRGQRAAANRSGSGTRGQRIETVVPAGGPMRQPDLVDDVQAEAEPASGSRVAALEGIEQVRELLRRITSP